MDQETRPSRAKLFIKPQLILLLPLAVYMLPLDAGLLVVIKLALLVPSIALITIPAVLFSILGMSLYDFGEFGALPKNAQAWVLIFLFWSLIAFLWSMRQVRRLDLTTSPR